MRAGIALGAALLVAGVPAAAQRAVWDQAQVVALAKQLDEAVDGFGDAVEKEPPPTAASGTPESGERLREKADRLETAAETLSGRLANGQGRDQTENSYKNVSQLASDTAELARNQMLSEPVLVEWQKVGDALKSLAPYYDAETPKPAAAERLDPMP